MANSLNVITDLLNTLPKLEKFAFHIANIFGQRERFHLHVLGTNGIHIQFFFGLIDYKKGPQLELEVHCTAGALRVLHKSLLRSSVRLQTRLVSQVGT